MKELPERKQLMLPLLETLAKHGGKAKPSDVVEELTEKFHVDENTVNATRTYRKGEGEATYNPWMKHVHWARMDAVLAGHIENKQRGLWELSEAGYDALQNATPGVIFTVYETATGQAVWATAETAVGNLRDNSTNLIFTSPPYPLESGKKSYGNKTGAEYIQWLGNIARDWHRSLTHDGSLVLNIADVWESGQPTVSLYVERLLLQLCDDIGFYLAQRCIWECPNRIPASYWVTHKRVRLNHSHEHLLWLSKTPHPKADNRRVLEPYRSPEGMEKMRQRRTSLTPGGHLSCTKAFHTDNGGRIPHSVLEESNASKDKVFSNACKKAGLPIHPARMPMPLAKFWINFLTDVGDHVHDSFLGSGTTARAAHELQRRWTGCDRSMTYLKASQLRFADTPVCVS